VIIIAFITEDVVVNCTDVKDFVPAPLEGDTYEGFETLVDRANSWLADLSGVVHVSLQSVLVQKGDRKYVSYTRGE